MERKREEEGKREEVGREGGGREGGGREGEREEGRVELIYSIIVVHYMYLANLKCVPLTDIEDE